MMSRPIIALSGPRCCGKSTIAGHLVSQHGYTRIAFADALREIAATANANLDGDRLYLARLGGKLRELVPDFFLQVVHNRLDSIEGPIVIEDVRFPSEYEFCRAIGAMTVRLEIPIETQLKRLASRDGKSGHEAEQLIECMDETALQSVTCWDYQVPAIGDFVELANTLHEMSLRFEYGSESINPLVRTQDIRRGVGA